MSKKYDDFFDELDKTTDLLKAFKPHIETESKNDSLEDLYNDMNMSVKEDKQSKESNQKSLEQILEEKKIQKQQAERIKQQEEQKQQQLQKKIEEEEKEQARKEQARLLEQQLLQAKKKKEQQKQESLQEIFNSKDEKKEQSTKAEKTDISEIVEKINESVEQTKQKYNKKQQKVEKKSKKKEKAKFSGFEIIFCSLSFLFILGCFAVYGSRLFKYYKIYNPKSTNGDSLMLLTTAIGKNSKLVYEGDGLYMSGGEYVYKGKNVDNYVSYSNFTWRILKTNNDGSIDLVLDEYINSMPWASRPKNYLESDVHKYLNEYFIKYLDTSYLAQTPICKDEVNDIKGFSCNNKNEEYYVRLLSINEFLNSKTETTYISEGNETLWLNTVSNDKTWQINGSSLSLADPTRALGIKPVIKLKSGVALISGDGTKENPYLVEEKDNNVHVGQYAKLGNDTYVIYNIEDEYYDLALSTILPFKYRYTLNGTDYNSTVKDTMAFYLNGSYLAKLPYKDLLVDKEWNIGKYVDSYENVTSNKVIAKVGLLDIMDLKFDVDLQEYFILTGTAEKIYVYGNESALNNPTIYQNIRPAIRIKKITATSGDGSKTNPYIMGA